MTLKEAKDKIAKKHGFESWVDWYQRSTFGIHNKFVEEAAELYAESKYEEGYKKAKLES